MDLGDDYSEFQFEPFVWLVIDNTFKYLVERQHMSIDLLVDRSVVWCIKYFAEHVHGMYDVVHLNTAVAHLYLAYHRLVLY